MRYKAWLIILAMPTWIIPSMACNICSGNSSIQGIGLNGIHNSNMILLNCGISRFHSDHMSGFDDRFVMLDLIARIGVGDNWKISAFIPYKWATRFAPEKSSSLNGIGDLKLVLSKVALDQKEIGNFASVSCEIGLGLSVPSSSGILADENPDLPRNFLGNSKNWGIVADVSTVIRAGNTGLILEANYQIPLENGRQELSGQALGANVLAFHQLDAGEDFIFFPSLGLSIFKNGAYRLSDGTYLFGSSGRSLSIPIGINIRYNAMALGLSHAFPVFEDYGKGEIHLNSKSNFNLSFIF